MQLLRLCSNKIPLMQPTKLIEYDSAFTLSEISQKIIKYYPLDYYKKNLYRKIVELENIHKDIILTLDRINDHLSLANKQLELFNKMANRMITKDEEKEYRESFNNNQMGYLNLDVRILFVFIGVFMDKIPKLLNRLFKSEGKPEDKSFLRYEKTITKYKGDELDELKNIIRSAVWYYGKNRVKDIRDDYIIHHPAGQGLSSRGPNSISSTIGTRRNEVLRLESISNESIQAIILLYESFIKDIYNFIKENYDNIPFEIIPI